MSAVDGLIAEVEARARPAGCSRSESGELPASSGLSTFALQRRSAKNATFADRFHGGSVMRRYAHLALALVAACTGAFTADTAAADKMGLQPRTPATSVRGEGAMPALDGAVAWLNSKPLSTAELRGKVVLVEFWTYTCINWQRTLPHVRAWADKYKDQGLVVIGVHTPEFSFEKDLDNDPRRPPPAGGRLPGRRRQRAGDLARVPQRVLAGALHRRCARVDPLPPFRRGTLRAVREGHPAAPGRGGSEGRRYLPRSRRRRRQPADGDWDDLRTPETYVGAARAENFASPGGLTVGREQALRGPGAAASSTSGRFPAIGTSGARAGDARAGERSRRLFAFMRAIFTSSWGLPREASPCRFAFSSTASHPGPPTAPTSMPTAKACSSSSACISSSASRSRSWIGKFEIEFLEPGSQVSIRSPSVDCGEHDGPTRSRRRIPVDVDHRLCEGLRRFLRQVVTDAAGERRGANTCRRTSSRRRWDPDAARRWRRPRG